MRTAVAISPFPIGMHISRTMQQNDFIQIVVWKWATVLHLRVNQVKWRPTELWIVGETRIVTGVVMHGIGIVV